MNFSVLMSIYKNDKTNEVDASIKSILDQSAVPDQIVIVIDGPVGDELSSLVYSYAADNSTFKIVPLEKNMGLGAALRIGLLHCDNELVARMDSDDISVSDRFEKQLAFFDQNPQIDIVGGQIAEYDSKMEHLIGRREVPEDIAEIKKMMKSRNGMNHVTVMYKKSKVIEAGNYQHCPYFEDYYLWCRMLANGALFHNLDSVLVNVRAGEDMYRRRGGHIYNAAIIDFQKKILDLKIISYPEFIKNIVIRISVANVPNSVRGFIYQKKLRTQ